MKFGLRCLMLLLIAVSTQAAEPLKPTAPAVAASEQGATPATGRGEAAKKVRCVNEQITGSRFAKRVCHTEEEWARIKENGVEAVKNIQSKPIPVQAG